MDRSTISGFANFAATLNFADAMNLFELEYFQHAILDAACVRGYDIC